MAGETGKQAYLLKEIESHGVGIIFPEQNGDRSVWTAFERYERGIVASTVLFCLYMTRLSEPSMDSHIRKTAEHEEECIPDDPLLLSLCLAH